MIEQQSRKKREVKNARAFIDSSSTTPFFFRPRLLATRSFSSISTIGKAITRYVGHKSNCQSVSPSLSHVEEASSFWGSSFILQQMIHDGLAFYLESTSFQGINSHLQTTRISPIRLIIYTHKVLLNVILIANVFTNSKFMLGKPCAKFVIHFMYAFDDCLNIRLDISRCVKIKCYKNKSLSIFHTKHFFFCYWIMSQIQLVKDPSFLNA